jgi:hypothetical protein
VTGKRAGQQQLTMSQEVSKENVQAASNFHPYHVTNKDSTYFDSYDVFLAVSSSSCGFVFAANQYLYIKNYFIIFDKYNKKKINREDDDDPVTRKYL